MRGICDDLDAETDALRAVVAGLTEDEWRLPTPADGWDTHETVSNTHLTLPTTPYV